MDSEASEIAANPLSSILLCDCKRRTGATKEICDKITFVRRRFDYSFKECFGLLCGVARRLVCLRMKLLLHSDRQRGLHATQKLREFKRFHNFNALWIDDIAEVRCDYGVQKTADRDYG
jgi:hypothetical protein